MSFNPLNNCDIDRRVVTNLSECSMSAVEREPQSELNSESFQLKKYLELSMIIKWP